MRIVRWQASAGRTREATNAGMMGLGLSDQDFFARIGYNFPMGGA